MTKQLACDSIVREVAEQKQLARGAVYQVQGNCHVLARGGYV